MTSDLPFQGRIFDLRIDSDIALTRLAECNGREREHAVIRRGSVPVNGLANAVEVNEYWQGRDGVLWLRVPDVVRIMVRGGNEIIYDPANGIDDDTIRLFVLGSGLGALMIQRGHLVLHANGVEMDGRAVMCMGPSGIGKSTLAAGFMRAGCRLISDDVCPINSANAVLPGASTIKLWNTSTEQLQIETKALRRVRPSFEKFDVPIDEHILDQSLPAGMLVELATHAEKGFKVETISGAEKFEVLRRNTYRLGFVHALSLQQDHFAACLRVANSVPVLRVTRPEAGFDVEGLVETVRNSFFQFTTEVAV